MQSNFELRRKLLQLEALYDVGGALNTLRPEDELLEELMQRAVWVLDATLGFVTSLDEKLNVQNLYVFGIEPASPPAALLAEPPLRQVLSSRQSLSVQVSKFLGGAGSDLLLAPMIAGDDIVGILGVGGKEERGAKSGSFLDDDLRFLESLASIGAAAIDNTRNYHRLTVIRESLEDENRNLKQRMLREYNDRLMVGDSPKMQRVIDLVARVADSQANVLIRGESGTGKEMVARLIHGNSPRKDGPFVAINCAALPETLLESELFGIERGVATGVEARPGRFEMARGGTVFLDEIGDIPPTPPAKLLRVLQEREIGKLGGRRRHRRRGAAGPVRDGPRRDSVPRRDRRHPAHPAGQAAAGAAGARDREARRPAPNPHRRPHPLRHAPRARRDDRDRRVPPGSLLPAQSGRDRPPPPARPPRRHPQARQILP